MAMEALHKFTKEKDEWKRAQLQMTTDLEKLSHDNHRLQASEGQHDAEVQALCATKEKVEHAMVALQAELANVKMECQVTISAVNKYKGSLVDADTENRRLVRELEKGQSLAHANVKCLLQRFQEATTAKIQAYTANALKEWCEQAAELHLL
jgi:archaellum component FlaC